VNGFVVQRLVSDMVTNRIGAVADEGPFGLKSMVLVEEEGEGIVEYSAGDRRASVWLNRLRNFNGAPINFIIMRIKETSDGSGCGSGDRLRIAIYYALKEK
jgi:hypothetical protein